MRSDGCGFVAIYQELVLLLLWYRLLKIIGLTEDFLYLNGDISSAKDLGGFFVMMMVGGSILGFSGSLE